MKSQYLLTALQVVIPAREDMESFLFRADTDLKNLKVSGSQQITEWNFWPS